MTMSNKKPLTGDHLSILWLALALTMFYIFFFTMWRIDDLQEDFEQATYRCVMIDKVTFECSILEDDNE